MFFFDTHAHLCDDQIWDQRETILLRMYEAQVREVGLICTNPRDLERAYELQLSSSQSPSYPVDIHLSAATGPNEVLAEGEEFFPLVAQAASRGKLKAIGEIGLDYHWQTSPVELQKEWMIRYLNLALEHNLPIVIHCRKAFDDIITLLDKYYLGQPGSRPGIFHCFAEGLEEAKKVIDRNFAISFSGIITYKSASYLQQVAKIIPPTSYVIETDSPYLTPGKHRNELNDPSKIPLIAETLALCRNESLDQIALHSRTNARRIFGLF